MSKRYLHDIKLIPRSVKPFKKLGVFFLVLLVLFILTILGHLLANFVVGGGFSWVSGNKIKLNGLNYYLIHFGEYDDEVSASDCLFWTASGGGASYIQKFDKYIVCGQIYTNYDQASLVMDNFGEDLTYEPKLINIRIPKQYLKVDGVSALHKKTISVKVNMVSNIIDEILDISNKLDKNQISKVSASSDINSLKSNVKITALELSSINANYNSDELNKVINFFTLIEDSLDVCTTKLLSLENYSNVCKYCACEIFFNYYDFMENFDK